MEKLKNNAAEISAQNKSLDPQDWTAIRKLGHQMIDDVMDLMENIRNQPVWKPFPEASKDFLKTEIPLSGMAAEEVYAEFKAHIFPYFKGNIHPRFWAWVQGTGSPMGVLAELMAAAMNPNVAIGEHSAMYVELQVLEWCKQLMNFPSSASGVLVSGATMANVTALTVARNHQLGENIRENGLKNTKGQLVLYCSEETHSCIHKAAEVLGIGFNGIRIIPVDSQYKMRIDLLEETIRTDKASGKLPFCVVGNAGTVNTGAIDSLAEQLAICRRYNLWFHVDGAFGALAKLLPEYNDILSAVEQADSVAFDLHKWMYVPYEAGCALIRDAKAHKGAFAGQANYLLNHERGLAAGPDPVGNYGIELSRGFKALKIWMTLKENGLHHFRDLIRQNIAQAFYLGNLIETHPKLELLSPVTMNITCYRYIRDSLTDQELNDLNKELLMRLQEEGIASPSSTILNGKYAIRVAITNQRSQKEDFDLLIKETLRIGSEI